MTSAYVMTYDNLVTDIINYMERDDAQFIAQIPNLIGLAESAIAAELKTLLQLTVVETNIAANQSVLAKPARWRKTVSMKTNGIPMLIRSQDYVSQYQSQSSPGIPTYYAEYDYNNWNFAPLPDATYPVEIIYYSEIQPLDSQNQQNLFTRECPQAMLFGALLQAQGYLKALDKLPIWKQYYTDSLAALKKEDNSRRIDRNTTIQEP
jgi:hypothetical protein